MSISSRGKHATDLEEEHNYCARRDFTASLFTFSTDLSHPLEPSHHLNSSHLTFSSPGTSIHLDTSKHHLSTIQIFHSIHLGIRHRHHAYDLEQRQQRQGMYQYHSYPPSRPTVRPPASHRCSMPLTPNALIHR